MHSTLGGVSGVGGEAGGVAELHAVARIEAKRASERIVVVTALHDKQGKDDFNAWHDDSAR